MARIPIKMAAGSATRMAAGLSKKQVTAFAVVAVVIVAGIVFATVFLQAPPGAPKTGEEKAIDLLGGELGAVQDLDVDEMENLLKLMVS